MILPNLMKHFLPMKVVYHINALCYYDIPVFRRPSRLYQ